MHLPRMTSSEAAASMAQGGVVIFPTEAGYVLGCRAFDAQAVARVVAIKHRPDGKPLPVLLSSAAALRRHFDSPLTGLAEHFWPGPLTLVVPAFPGLPASVTGGTNMVGVRASAHPIARFLVERLGEPVVATSANRTGAPAAHNTNACDLAGLDGVSGLVDGGILPPGSNTVVGMSDGDLVFFATGDLPEHAVRAAWATTRGY